MIDDEALLRAIDDAERGPDESDLFEAPMLSRWWLEPDHVLLRAVGECTGHPLISDPYVKTSPILDLDVAAGWLRSRSRWYRLGPPADPVTMAILEPEARRHLATLRGEVRAALIEERAQGRLS